MNIEKFDSVLKDRKVILSTLWIFALLNYIYADLFTSFFNPAAHSGSVNFPQTAVLVFAVFMETAIMMVLFSRILNYGVNRWLNIIFGIFHTGFVAWSMLGSTPLPFYIFFAGIEMACTLFIAWYAWKWQKQDTL